MRLSDEHLKLAMVTAMRRTVERLEPGDMKEQLQRGLERWESGEEESRMTAMDPAALPMFFDLLRDFIHAANNPPRPRRRNMPKEQADAIAERVAARAARNARKHR